MHPSLHGFGMEMDHKNTHYLQNIVCVNSYKHWSSAKLWDYIQQT
jgi:hypothetical protein